MKEAHVIISFVRMLLTLLVVLFHLTLGRKMTAQDLVSIVESDSACHVKGRVYIVRLVEIGYFI